MSRLGLLPLIVLAMAVGCGSGQASPIQDPDMVVQPAPDPAQAVHFPPGTSTAGVAHIGPALDKVDITSHDCSPLKPCALATPAISDATTGKSRSRLGEGRPARRRG